MKAALRLIVIPILAVISVHLHAQEGGIVRLPDEMKILNANTLSQNRAFAKAQPSWKAFMAEHPSWNTLWNTVTNTPHRAWGSGIRFPGIGLIDSSNAEAAAWEIAEQFASLLHLDKSSARLLQAEAVNGKWYFKFGQTYNGLNILNTFCDLRTTSNGKLFLIGSDFIENIRLNTQPSIGYEAAMEFAKAGLEYTLGTSHISQGELAILPLTHEAYVEPHLVYVFVVNQSPVERWATYVDAHSGEVLWRHNLVRSLHEEGGRHKPSSVLKGRITADVSKVSYVLGTEVVPVAHAEVVVNGTKVVTDANGEFSVDVGSQTNISCSTKFFGPYTWVRRGDAVLGGRDATITINATPGNDVLIHWDDGNSTASERNMFHHVNTVREFIRSIDPSNDLSDLDKRMTSIVRLATGDSCNAFWDGQKMNFYLESISCADPASIADVVYHEYGHAINQYYYIKRRGQGMINGALGEATADANANLLLDNPDLGLGFFRSGANGGILRTSNNTKRYPGDIMNEVHYDGEILAGAIWDMRLAVGLETARRLAHFAKKGTPDASSTGLAFVDYFIELLVADDDDGDLSNGTPHSEQISRAFLKHGIPAYIVVSHSPIADQSGFSMDGYPINGSVTVTPIIANPVTVSTQGVKVFYSTDNWKSSSERELPLNSATTFDGTFPWQKPGSIVRYYVESTDNFGGKTRDPFSAPLKSYLFLVGYQTKLLHTMETDEGWAVDPDKEDDAETGFWIRSLPIGTGAQPDSDHTVGSQNTICWVTGNAPRGASLGQNDVDEGKTTLQSPAFDLTSYTNPVVRYWRWYSNDRGATPGTDYWIVQISNDDGNTWVDLENTNQAINDWVAMVFPVRDYLQPTDRIRLRFIASDYPPGSLVEAALDDFEILDINPNINSTSDIASAGGIHLEQNYPNPFGVGGLSSSTTTSIRYTLPSRSFVTLKVYNSLGSEVAILESADREPGLHVTSFNAADLPAGTYIYELTAGKTRRVKRMSVIH